MAPKKELKEKAGAKGGKGGKVAHETPEETTPTPSNILKNVQVGLESFTTLMVQLTVKCHTEGEWLIAPELGAGEGQDSTNMVQTHKPKQKGGKEAKKKDEKLSKDKSDSKKEKEGNPKTPPKSPNKGEVRTKDEKSKEESTFDATPPKEGHRLNRVRHGMGVYIDGDYKYEGEWKDDKMCGQGTFKYASGSSYIGTWDMNKYSGKGEYKWADGRSYSGDWRDNKMHGNGVYKDQCGQNFVGHFFNGIGPGLLCEIK